MWSERWQTNSYMPSVFSLFWLNHYLGMIKWSLLILLLLVDKKISNFGYALHATIPTSHYTPTTFTTKRLKSSVFSVSILSKWYWLSATQPTLSIYGKTYFILYRWKTRTHAAAVKCRPSTIKCGTESEHKFSET